jgi:hypothetical protein
MGCWVEGGFHTLMMSCATGSKSLMLPNMKGYKPSSHWKEVSGLSRGRYHRVFHILASSILSPITAGKTDGGSQAW